MERGKFSLSELPELDLSKFCRTSIVDAEIITDIKWGTISVDTFLKKETRYRPLPVVQYCPFYLLHSLFKYCFFWIAIPFLKRPFSDRLIHFHSLALPKRAAGPPALAFKLSHEDVCNSSLSQFSLLIPTSAWLNFDALTGMTKTASHKLISFRSMLSISPYTELLLRWLSDTFNRCTQKGALFLTG